MKKLLLAVLASAATLGLGSCGDGNSVKCGTGTTLVDGTCEPDGSTICEQGTKFNPETSTCELDPTACGPGTALLDGQCVNEDDAMAADLQEEDEPNDSSGAGEIDVPAVDQATTFHGCITPKNGEPDSDPWIITTTEPALIEVTADGVHGLAAGFAMLDGTGNPLLASWQRLGVNLVGDMSKRQIFLPAAGAYVLLMDDSRALLLGSAAGGPDTCYFGTLKHVALPAATALTLPTTSADDVGNAKVFSFSATSTGDILDLTQNTSSSSMVPSFVVMRNNQLAGVAVADTANSVPPFFTAGGLNATGDAIAIVVDNEYNYALTPQGYSLDGFRIASQALPTDGSSVTLTKHNGETPNAGYVDLNFSYFDVATAGQIVHFNLTSTDAVQMLLARRDIFTPTGSLDAVASINTTPGGTSSFSGQYVRFATPGRYYFITVDPAGTAGDTYELTSTLTNMTTTAITYGTPMTAQALTAQGATFYKLDTQNTYEWIELGVPAAANWGGQARVTLYDLAGSGWLTTTAGNYAPLQTGNQVTDGSGPLGRITLGDARDYLVRIEPTMTPGASPTFTLDVKERAHVNLGTISAPIDRTDNTPGGSMQRYLIKGTTGYVLDVNATAASDIRIDRRNADESIIATSDVGGDGVAESTKSMFFATPGYQAFTITNKGAAAEDIDLEITSPAPLPYTDICPTGTALPAPLDGTGDDDFSAAQSLPGGYSFYGASVSNFLVNANGFLVFGTSLPACAMNGCYQNAALSAASAPNDLAAGYWDDLQNVKICRKDGTDTVTLQYTGNLWGLTTTVEFQTVLHKDGAVDFIYGPNHQANGGSATVGVKNAAGTASQQLVLNVAGATPPSSSYSITTP